MVIVHHLKFIKIRNYKKISYKSTSYIKNRVGDARYIDEPSLVTILFGLERTLQRNAQVVTLFWGQFG